MPGSLPCFLLFELCHNGMQAGKEKQENAELENAREAPGKHCPFLRTTVGSSVNLFQHIFLFLEQHS